EGYEVELAADGAEALYRLDTGAVHPDAIVLDVLMPNVDGLETARRLRGAGNRTPILMLTARDEVEARVAGLDAGADDYVVKPFALAELLARLRALLELARRLHRLPEAQDRGGRTAKADPDGSRRRLRAPRTVSFRTRLTLVAAAAVAFAVVIASLVVFLVVRNQLRGQVDDALQ